MPARLFRTDLDLMATEILVHRDQETGGSLFGAWSHTGQPLIYAVSGPGPGARHGATSFFPCPDHMERLGGRLFSSVGLQHIGEWHSHHRLGLAEPSHGDIRTVWTGMQEHGLRRFVLAIGNITGSSMCHQVPIGFWLFDADTGRHTQLPVETWRGRSPIVRDQGIVSETWTRRNAIRVGRGRWTVNAPEPAPRLQRVTGGAWYAERHVQQALATSIRELTSHPAVDDRPKMRPVGDTLELTATVRGTPVRWTLGRGFPRRPPRLEWDGVPTVEPWDPERGVSGQLDRLLAPPVREWAWHASADPPAAQLESATPSVPQPTPPRRGPEPRWRRKGWSQRRGRQAYGIRRYSDSQDDR